MNKQELKAYKQLVIRKEKLESEIMDMKASKKYEYAADIVNDYRSGHGKRTKIEGITDKRYIDAMQKKEKILLQINHRIKEVDDFIEHAFAYDELVGNILYSQYKEFKTLEEIAEEQNYCVRTINNKMKKFWKSVQENSF